MKTILSGQDFSARAASRRGFSIMEVVVAMVIIAILVLILTPTLTNRSNQARLRSAEQELGHIVDAQERAALDTGYLFRLYVLNDVIGGDDISNDGQLTRGTNGTRDNRTGVTEPDPLVPSPFPVHTNPSKIFISIQTLDFVTDYQTLYDERFSGRETAFGWVGPYITWKRDVNRNDWPDDPWGHDYIMFTPVGMLLPRDPNDTTRSYPDDEFVVTATGTPFSNQNLDEAFDRATILSLGPDGLPGDGVLFPDGSGLFGTGDDLVRKF